MKARLAGIAALTVLFPIIGAGVALADHAPTGPLLPGGNQLGPYNYNDQFASALDPSAWFNGKLLILSPLGANARIECYYYRDTIASCQQYAPDGSAHYLNPTPVFDRAVFVYTDHP